MQVGVFEPLKNVVTAILWNQNQVLLGIDSMLGTSNPMLVEDTSAETADGIMDTSSDVAIARDGSLPGESEFGKISYAVIVANKAKTMVMNHVIVNDFDVIVEEADYTISSKVVIE
ncbi:hypothetical protein V6N13_108729 [Hibiscus sabdariffa]